MKNKNIKNKRIDFFVRKQQNKRDNRTYRYGTFTTISIIILILFLSFAAFLVLDTARMERKIVEGEAMLQDPELLQFYQDVESLKQKERMYLSIKDSLANLDVITATYPNVDRHLFNHLLLENDPGLAISNISYDGNSGQLNFEVRSAGYGGWTNFVNKMENSSFISDFNYSGYQRDIASGTYFSGFSVRLVKESEEGE